VVKNLPSRPRDQSHLILIEDVISIHGESLPAACLAIGKNSTVIPIHDILDHLTANLFKNLRLGGLRIEYVVKSESEIATLSVKFLYEANGLLIIVELHYRALLRVELLYLILDIVIRPEASHNFDGLSVISVIVVGRQLGVFVTHYATFISHVRCFHIPRILDLRGLDGLLERDISYAHVDSICLVINLTLRSVLASFLNGDVLLTLTL
jgi:hypothetical protein